MMRIPHLETNITVACQLRCVSCNHLVALQSGIAKSTMARPDVVYRDLSALSRFVHTKAWGALGGEPTLHPDLVPILQAAQASRIADIIEVWTNGISIRKQKPQFWQALKGQVLVVSAYPGTLTDDDLVWIDAKCRDEDVRLTVKDERRVPNFERLLEPHPSGRELTERKYAGCFFRQFSRVVDNGYFFRCCTSPFIPKLLMGGRHGDDGVPIHEPVLTEEALQAFLDRRDPMPSCTRCVGLNPQDRQRQPWREVREPAEWLRASSGVDDGDAGGDTRPW